MQLQGTAKLLPALIIVFCVVEAGNASCPATSTPVLNETGQATWCVRDLGNQRSFCQAVRDCHSIGEEMISREVFFAMRNSSFAAPLKYWVGLTDALDERGSSKAGWVWIRDGQRTPATGSGFRSNEPNLEPDSMMEDCVFVYVTDLADITCNPAQDLSVRALCYSNSDGSPVLPADDRKQANFVKVEIVSFIQPDPGCWIDESSRLVTSDVHCSFKCVAFGPDCIGFYWNSARQECIILPYFDAAVPLSFSSRLERLKWEKFVSKFTL